ncbi:hypothetical protein WALSEDRAFT_31542 [Wallemia mellicola CBS 633.66]|uniref:GST C-terminal domain-containing protein n=1 Tax=Wallemia mellicola (strain ATCC MYA-4683 / CBS 633.66) TaxID=671144 RepID=I4YFT0_WALMC|nr:hypothetical protein WALSEDRAFT_31542 [Wallemia mellicola CBS 633.66]EIM22822.1 hypothetical protein WALSEDRAFT_31542 [Wallemia mellicola CBS 633.66]|eukprot:XP_006956875.1 hypothetical protein WALSEDRAFT_31542 [Wallemia mellicola CBS 633.66]
MTADILKFADKDGEFRRQVSAFRDEIKSGTKFEPEFNRYHLVVCYACPWAHRALIVRALKGLEDFLPLSVVHPYISEDGWTFDKNFEGATGCQIDGVDATLLRDLYFTADKNYNARYTVPIIWDNKLKTIVSNESSEIIRFLNNLKLDAGGDIYPEHLRGEIDELNDWVYNTVNNGVYKSGFASTQQAYENHVKPLFESLDRLEKILSDGRDFLVGGQLTEADVRLYTTIVRFDPVYYSHFKCNLAMIRYNYPNINRWMKNLYWNNDAFKSTTNFDHIKYHYYHSQRSVNASGVVPLGPVPNIEPL